MQLITGWTLALLFQVAHLVEEVDFPQAKPTADGHNRVEFDWAKAQVATTADFCPGSFFWLHFSGGLSYQVRAGGGGRRRKRHGRGIKREEWLELALENA